MISWGMIGCGSVTEVKSGPAFSKVPGSRLVAVMRRNRPLAEDYAHRHKVPKVFSSADDLIHDKEIDAIYVATPPSSHMEYALAAISAGKPVYIEKPMALNYSECLKINSLAQKKGIPVFVAYYRRSLPGFLRVRELIDSGSIGKIRHVQIRLFKSPTEDERSGRLPWRVDPAISGGGHFFDLASHQLDFMDYVFGPAQKLSSVVLNQGGHYKAEDFVSAEFLHQDNVVVSGTWCFSLSPENNMDIIEVNGSEGLIRFSSFSFENIILENDSGRKEYLNERPEHVQYFLIDSIVRTLVGNATSPSTGISASRTSRVMDEVVREYYYKQKLNNSNNEHSF